MRLGQTARGRTQVRRNLAYVLGFVTSFLVVGVIALVNPHFDGSALALSGGLGLGVAVIGSIFA